MSCLGSQQLGGSWDKSLSKDTLVTYSHSIHWAPPQNSLVIGGHNVGKQQPHTTTLHTILVPSTYQSTQMDSLTRYGKFSKIRVPTVTTDQKNPTFKMHLAPNKYSIFS